MLRILKKFDKLFNRRQKNRLIIVFLLMLIGAGLETVSVSLALPLVSAVVTPEKIENDYNVIKICELLGIKSLRTFILIVIVCMIIIFILKNLFLYFEYYIQAQFVCNNRFRTQKLLLTSYLSRPYEYFLNSSSGEIVRIVNSDASNAFALLTTMLSFYTEIIISIALVVTIVVINPLMAFVIALIMLSVMIVIAKIVKPILKKASSKYQKNATLSNKWLLQSIAGIKEIKVTKKQDFFVEQYSKYGAQMIQSEKKNLIIANVPRLTIESISMCGMLILIALLVLFGRNLKSLLPEFSAFAISAVRLLPSINRISAAINSISYQEPMLDKLLENITALQGWENGGNVGAEEYGKGEHGHLTMEKEVRLSGISYTYPEGELAVLQGAEMVIPIGMSIGIVGASGAGKTTVVDILLGLLKPQNGEVLADGISIKENYREWLSFISYIPQSIYMLDDTIRANVAFGHRDDDIDDTRIWEVLEEAQLAGYIKGLPEGLSTAIGERGIRMSGGQRQRIGIARALYTNPQLLVFDEATSALDNETESAIMEAINRLHGKKTLIIIAHRLETIQECDMVYRVENGKILRER